MSPSHTLAHRLGMSGSPPHPSILALGECAYALLATGRYDQAWDVFEALRALFPRDASPLLGHAEVALCRGDPERCIASCKQAMAQPNGSRDVLALASLLMARASHMLERTDDWHAACVEAVAMGGWAGASARSEFLREAQRRMLKGNDAGAASCIEEALRPGPDKELATPEQQAAGELGRQELRRRHASAARP